MIVADQRPAILYVESDQAVLQQFADDIQQLAAGYDVYVASTGNEAQGLLDHLISMQQEIALVLAPEQLNDVNGLVFLTQVYERWPHALRVLLCLPNSPLLQAPELERARLFRVLFQPLEALQLRLTMQEALRHHAQRYELMEKSRILSELHRATMSITGEINLENLLHKLMRILIDNADAEHAYIVMPDKNGTLYIEAAGQSGSYETILAHQEVTDFSPVCPAVLEYGMKSRENVVLHDAVNEGFFSNHPYIRRNFCRSVTCVPLVYQGQMFGFLYLDNASKPNAFSPYSLELFKLLSAPAAVAIQNAQLYGVLEQRVQERTGEVVAQKRQLEIQKDEIQQKNDDIMGSIRYARRIQEALLPKASEMRELLPQSFVYYKPKDIVSGDFFWISQRLSKIILAAADCTGHGIPGAFMTIMSNTLLKQVVELEGIFKPSEILHQLDLRVRMALQQDSLSPEVSQQQDGMDCAICQIDIRRNKLIYAGANRPLVLIRNGELIEYKPDKYGIGGEITGEITSREYTEHTIDILPGDTYYMFSDGYQDQIGEEVNKRFKARRFYQMLLDLQERDMEHQRVLLDAELRHWRGDLEQTDDILILGVRF
jgi:serine phosphatase RsbU (regulator of sigma subunit)/DNA-binding response OmpR family regulator